MRKYGKQKWRTSVAIVSVGLLIGIPIGTSTATFLVADGFSYLSKNPKACVNCHIMQANYDSWSAASHHTFATCNDCHTSGSWLSRYSQKALNGFLHSWAFSTGHFKEPIRIKGFNQRVVVRSCLSCHAQFIESSPHGERGFATRNCIECHQNVGHRKW